MRKHALAFRAGLRLQNMARMQDWLTSLTSPDLFGAVRLFLNSALSDFGLGGGMAG
jgi:hypothetical protein